MSMSMSMSMLSMLSMLSMYCRRAAADARPASALRRAVTLDAGCSGLTAATGATATSVRAHPLRLQRAPPVSGWSTVARGRSWLDPRANCQVMRTVVEYEMVVCERVLPYFRAQTVARHCSLQTAVRNRQSGRAYIPCQNASTTIKLCFGRTVLYGVEQNPFRSAASSCST